MTKTIGARLTLAINASLWSRKALAARAGVRPEAISRLEKGERLPETHSLQAIAMALGVTGGWLVFGEGGVPTIPLAAPEDRDQRRADRDTGPS